MASKSRLLIVVVASVTLVCGSLNSQTVVKAEEERNPIQWDDHEAHELAHTLHHMHELVNEGKFEEAEKMIAGDDVLVTFELGLDDNSSPVALRSKKEVFKFMKDL